MEVMSRKSTIFSLVLIGAFIWFEFYPKTSYLMNICDDVAKLASDLDRRLEKEKEVKSDLEKYKRGIKNDSQEKFYKESLIAIHHYEIVTSIRQRANEAQGNLMLCTISVMSLNVLMIEGIIRGCDKLKLTAYLFSLVYTINFYEDSRKCFSKTKEEWKENPFEMVSFPSVPTLLGFMIVFIKQFDLQNIIYRAYKL